MDDKPNDVTGAHMARENARIELQAELHNIVLLTVSAGRLVMFNFNSTVAEFPKVERGLRASIASIKVQS